MYKCCLAQKLKLINKLVVLQSARRISFMPGNEICNDGTTNEKLLIIADASCPDFHNMLLSVSIVNISKLPTI